MAVPQWRDEPIVECKGGKVVFRSRFLGCAGVCMVDPRMMNHEEMGMMQAVEVHNG